MQPSTHESAFCCVTAKQYRPRRLRLVRSGDYSLLRPIRSSGNSLRLNYQVLEKEENATIIGWKYDTAICNTFFKVQGYIFATNLMANNDVINTTDTLIDIPSNMLVTGEEPVYFRVVAIEEGGEVCSDLVTQRTFYRFDGNYFKISYCSCLNFLVP